MKYKIGDKVRIKKGNYHSAALEAIDKLTNRISTIVKVNVDSGYYGMKEMEWAWEETMIECLASEHREPKPEILDPIETRFEILDL